MDAPRHLCLMCFDLSSCKLRLITPATMFQPLCLNNFQRATESADKAVMYTLITSPAIYLPRRVGTTFSSDSGPVR